LVFLSVASPIHAQSSPFEIGGGYSLLRLNVLEEPATRSGITARLGYDLHDHVSVEGEVLLFPQNLGGISKGMTAAFFGAKVGKRFERIGLFGKARPGLFHFQEPEQPFACVAVVPPPVACVLGGSTNFALDAGGVVEFYLSNRFTVRADAGDTMIRVGGPVLRSGSVESSGYWSHNFMFGTSLGFRF
jgi:hypothetical protein